MNDIVQQVPFLDQEHALPAVKFSGFQLSKALLFFLVGLGGYLFFVLLSTAPVSYLRFFPQPKYWLTKEILHYSTPHVPDNLHIVSDGLISHQHTGFFELLFFMLLALLCYIFCAFCIYKQRAGQRLTLIVTILAAFFVGLMYVYTQASLSDDVVPYIFYGRILAVYHANPYFDIPIKFSQDPLYPDMYWKNVVTGYGPIWTLVSAGLAGLGNGHELRSIMLFRFMSLGLHLCNTLLVMAILRASGQKQKTIVLGTFLYGLNPFLVFECCNGAHNDFMMIMFILLGLWRAIYAIRSEVVSLRTALLPVLLLATAGLIKYSALPVCGLFIVLLMCKVLRQDSRQPFFSALRLHWRQALFYGIILSLLVAVVFVGSYTPFMVGHSLSAIVNALFNIPITSLMHSSNAYTMLLLRNDHRLPAPLYFLTELTFWKVMSLLFMGCAFVIGVVLIWRDLTVRSLVLASLLFFAAFFYTSPYYYPWYASWVVSFVGLCLPLGRQRLARGLVAFALCLSWTTTFFYYNNVAAWTITVDHASSPFFNQELFLGIAGFALPVLVGILAVLPYRFNKRLATESVQADLA
ncbi:hypothetical protein KSC_097610 [Ktedonobacter sp. SOSP1-52]|uniref:hypothetical protein n=1 Tax=Ktedonobacter sp. SOSP1-52 TaxID=2778366 RepID=UPI0019168A68|nr:hypothetical protein [Ktedonobacter sp. SOSP1-52]GHO70869.1 hypothetical protein KSC_097610 [Ktedonobacter sp. SOSP1-52]